MKIAVLSDIHGNSAALDAVLRDIDNCGVELIINAGDHFSGPLDSAGTADRLLSRKMISISGNHDRWIVEQNQQMMGPSDHVADAQLTQAHRHWLKKLQPTTQVEDIFVCHGTPACDNTYWIEKVKPDGTVCMEERQQIEQHASGINASVIICGHTHLPRLLRLEDGRMLVNPGSVGCPGYDDVTPVNHVMQTGIPDAIYAILELKSGQWAASLRALKYDNREMVKLAEDAGRSDWASALKTGWVS